MRMTLAALMAAFLLLTPTIAQEDTNSPGVTMTDAAGGAPVATDTVVVQAEPAAHTDISSDTTVVIPAGDWLDSVLENIAGIVGSIIAILVAFAARSLPKAVGDLLITMKAEQLLTRAADYGINATRGAVRGKTLEINVGNEAIAKGAQYAIDNGPRWLIDWLGGPVAIREKIIARIPMSAEFGREDVR